MKRVRSANMTDCEKLLLIELVLKYASVVDNTLRYDYDTRCYFNVRLKADISQLNLPHGTDN